MNIVILLRLLFAHILSDFILQTDSINYGKKGFGKDGVSNISKLAKYLTLLLHSGIHALVAYFFIAQWKCWIIPTVIFVTHFAMDYIKSEYMKEGIISFVIDQVVHIAVLFVLWIAFFSDDTFILNWLIGNFDSAKFLSIIIAYLLVLKPASIFLNLFIKRWTPTKSSDSSLPNAGKWIGYLERILILTFILTNNMAGIGFLLAAKSIFRFGELSKAKDIKTTEYVLIGTFASFTIAIMIGCILLKVV